MRTLAIIPTIPLSVLPIIASEMPAPKEGLLISKNESEKIREKVINLEKETPYIAVKLERPNDV